MPDRAWPFAQGSAVTLLIATLVWITAVVLWYQFTSLFTGILLFLISSVWLLTIYFFRDPNRAVILKPGLVVSPGDGEVVEIKTEVEKKYLQKEVIRISFFLGLTDVHVQRVPLGGITKLIQHQSGKFIQAFRPEASDINEYIAMVTETAYGTVLIKQIAGILARRCVNYAQLEQPVTTGQRFGLIRFGSRLDLYLPPSATILVQVGDKVKGGINPIAQLIPLEGEENSHEK